MCLECNTQLNYGALHFGAKVMAYFSHMAEEMGSLCLDWTISASGAHMVGCSSAEGKNVHADSKLARQERLD